MFWRTLGFEIREMPDELKSKKRRKKGECHDVEMTRDCHNVSQRIQTDA